MTGNKFINDAVAGKVSFGSAPGIATAEYMQKLSQYFQAGYAQSNYDNMIDLFVGNRAAIMYNGTWCTAQGITGSDGNLLPRYGYFTLPKYKANDATPLTDYWANSGIGTAIKTESATPEMKDFLAFVFKRYPDISVEKYSAIPPIRPSASAKISTLLQTILKDIEGVKEYGYCWDVVINQGALETLDKAIIDLWLGRLTPQQWAKTMDDAVAESLKN
jgi:raffinose/stachyose/melibiose transport system substrate-binding protein